MALSEPWSMSMAEAARNIRTRTLSPLELMESVVERIAQVNPRVNAFTSLGAETALATARRATDLPMSQRSGSPFFGIPVSLKDLIDWRGLPTTASSRATSGDPAVRDATVADRLRRAGSILVGKTHTHEFAYGMTTPQTHNPRDHTRSPGGSSGGSAAAVAAGFGPLSIGTDTGGSVRVPASLCGVVGLKPTYGLVGRRGLMYLSWSLDHIGPIARTVEDIALTMNEIAGFDPEDPASVAVPGTDFTAELDCGVAGLTIGVPSNHFFDRCDPDVAEAITGAIEELQHLGATIRTIELPYAEAMVGVGNEITAVESGESGRDLLTGRADLIGDETRCKFEAGSVRSATTYLHALRAREVITSAWRGVMRDVDIVVTPTAPLRAPHRDELRWPPDATPGQAEPVGSALIRYTYCANITGLPALTVPVREASRLPAGMQVIGHPFAESTALRVAKAYQAG